MILTPKPFSKSCIIRKRPYFDSTKFEIKQTDTTEVIEGWHNTFAEHNHFGSQSFNWQPLHSVKSSVLEVKS